MPDPYDTLGVPPQSSRDQIERAYRRRVVEVHRRGVFGIVGKLRALQRARAALEDDAERTRWDERRNQAMASAGRSEAERRRRELQVLSAYKRKRARDASRAAATASRDNAELVQDIERRIDLAERAEARARLRQRVKTAVLGCALLLITMLGAWLIWQRWGGGF